MTVPAGPGIIRPRTAALVAWALFAGGVVLLGGVPGDVIGVMLLVWLFSIAWQIEQPPVTHLRFARDWAPIVLVLVAYTYTRGVADELGIGPFVRWPVVVDGWLGLGETPTERLQGWWCAPSCSVQGGSVWDALLSVVYVSHFVAAYAAAAWWYVTDRPAWRAWMSRFLTLYAAGLVIYVVHPLVPPWLAAERGALDPAVERISGRGILDLGVHLSRVLDGPVSNQVAAMPSLHAGTAVLLSLFVAARSSHRLRGLWMVYPALMCIALVYFAEHYVVDLVAGGVLAVVVHVAWSRHAAARHDAPAPAG